MSITSIMIMIMLTSIFVSLIVIVMIIVIAILNIGGKLPICLETSRSAVRLPSLQSSRSRRELLKLRVLGFRALGFRV